MIGTPTDALRIAKAADHPLRACYPYGGRDLVLTLAEPVAASALRRLVTELFTADPRCRRVVAAPAEDDLATQDVLEAAGFARVAEADLREGTVVLYATEPPSVAGVPTALDDMPH